VSFSFIIPKMEVSQMRWLSRLSVVLIVCLVIVGLTAAPVQAQAPTINLSPASGVPGEQVRVRGYNFTADEWVDIYYDGDLIDEVQTDDDGDFPWVAFTVPEGPAGAHKVRAEVNSTVYVEASFTVKPGLTVSPEEGPVGTNVTVRGLGFAKNEANIEVRYYLDGNYTAVVSNISANATGSWQRTFQIPPADQGSHKIDATGNSSSLAAVRDAFFEVKPGISLDRTSGSLGQNITMTGSGFGAGERDITIFVSGQAVRTGIRADNTGYWQENFPVPLMQKGTHNVTAEGESTPQSAVGILSFNITPGLVAAPDEGHVGMDLTVTGSGFPINQDVVIKYEGSQQAATSTNSSGSFTVVFPVPESQHGERAVTAEDDAGNSASAIFTLESQPPDRPELDSPADGSRLGSIWNVKPTFNWSAVTDDSGVYYSLQIATSPNATAEGFANPVRSITGIAATNYTLNGTQALSYGTYYWIVRAVDRAGNAGEWTVARSFNAGVLPLWALILIIVVVVAVIGTLVYFFVIRKRIYYY
jgi:IPT/TIG domain